MRYFEQQKKDEAGIIGVSLQKMLLILMFINFIGMFSVQGSFFPSLFNLLLLMIGYNGAFRRHPGMLLCYFLVSLFCIIAPGLIVLFVLVVLATTQGIYTDSSDSSSSSASSEHATSASTSASAVEVVQYQPYYLLYFLLTLLLAVLIVYVKVYSLILAHRMRKVILRDASLAVPSRAFVEDGAVDESKVPLMPNAPMFVQPGGYMMGNQAFPGHYAAGQQPMPYHHQGMYGQQPVFYTFAHPSQMQGYPVGPAPVSEKSIN
jgi:hypothetical protein